MGILFNGYMMVRLGWLNWARLIIWLAVGMIVYFSYGVKHSKVRQALREERVRGTPPVART
jgi:APA family basic amino acid/polyamine antiporter